MSSKKILLFGATGGTGFEVAKQLAGAGFIVTAVVRNPDSFALRHSNLKILKGDVLEPDSFDGEMKDSNAVISALGTGTDIKPTKVYSVGIKNIITEMQKNNLKRLICVSAAALYTNPQMGLFVSLLTKLVLQPILKNVYADMRLMEKEIQKSTLDFTIVRPAMLKNKPLTGKYRTAINTNLRKPFSISRADLAHFMIKSVDNEETYRSIVEISY